MENPVVVKFICGMCFAIFAIALLLDAKLSAQRERDKKYILSVSIYNKMRDHTVIYQHSELYTKEACEEHGKAAIDPKELSYIFTGSYTCKIKG